MFKLRIKTKNAAFFNGVQSEEKHEPQQEVVRILKQVIDRLEMGNTEESVFDINGNNVGEYKLTNR